MHGVTQRAGSDESYILLIFGLRGTYRVLITFRAYAAYFRTFLSLILTGWTWLIPYHLLGTYPTFFNLFSLIRAFSDQISKTDIY